MTITRIRKELNRGRKVTLKKGEQFIRNDGEIITVSEDVILTKKNARFSYEETFEISGIKMNQIDVFSYTLDIKTN